MCTDASNWRGVKTSNKWSQNLPCSECPNAHWPGCPKVKIMQPTTSYTAVTYALVSTSNICTGGSWAIDVFGNGIYASNLGGGKYDYMDCVNKLESNFPNECSKMWFAVSSNDGRCKCYPKNTNCSTTISESHSLYKKVNWIRHGFYQEVDNDRAMRYGPCREW